MDTIVELITNCKEKLENNTYSTNLVGNRMHYPMLITINGENAEITKDLFAKSFRRIWPQTHNNIVFIKNQLEKSETFIDFQTDSAIPDQELQNRLDALSSMHGAFEDFLKICVYNVIDTSNISTIDEFKANYNLIDKLKQFVVKGTKSLLVVLLDDSISKNEISTKIREYLSQNMLYDGVVIISTKCVNGEIYDYNEIAEIAASVILLSNNDAVTEKDDNDYNQRANMFYSSRTLSVAQKLLSRPNEKIVLQTIDILLNKTLNIVKSQTEKLSIEKWREILEIDNGQGVIKSFEDKLNSFDFDLNTDELKYIAYRSIPEKEFDFKKTTYAEFLNYVYPTAIEQYIQEKYTKNSVIKKGIEKMLDTYELNIKNHLSANECVGLTDEMINDLMANLICIEPSSRMGFYNYYAAKMKFEIRKNVIYPRIENILRSIRTEAEKTIKDYIKFCNKFIVQIPIEGFAELGTFYSTMVNNYINSPLGEVQIKQIVSPGNSKNEFLNKLFESFENIMSANQDELRLSFVQEWVKRLDLTGDVVFNTILNTFNSEFRKRLFLFGNFPIDDLLDVYIFNTHNKNGETDLYNYMLNAFNDTDKKNYQFINSGYDDMVEAIRFIDCSGNKLLL